MAHRIRLFRVFCLLGIICVVLGELGHIFHSWQPSLEGTYEDGMQSVHTPQSRLHLKNTLGNALRDTTYGKEWTLIACANARMDSHLLRSWVLWNHVAGIEHFVIFDNNDIEPNGQQDGFDEAVYPLVVAGLVTVHKYHKDVINNVSLADLHGLNKTQYQSLKTDGENFLKERCYDMYHERARWIALFDVDETFVKLKNMSLVEFFEQPAIKQNTSIGSVMFQWRHSSYSSFFKKPIGLDSFEPFDLCHEKFSSAQVLAANSFGKPIVRGSLRGSSNSKPRPVQRIINAHFPLLHPEYMCVSQFLDGQGCDFDSLSPHTPGAAFQLNHYYSRSVEDFLIKSIRGVHIMKHVDNPAHEGKGCALSGICFPELTSCMRVQDEPTKASAREVQLLRAKLNIALGPELVLDSEQLPNTDFAHPAMKLF